MGIITLRWIEDHLMMASDTNGHSVVIGRSPEGDHPWVGVKPSDLLLVAVASCSTWDLVEILAKQRQPLERLEVICTGEQQESPPYTFKHIHIRYEVCGKVDPEKLEKAIRLSEDKYCCVINSLRPEVSITNEYVIS
jgi:putative redox protein